MLFLVPTAAWAPPPPGVGPPHTVPIDADTLDGYHATDIINPLQANIDAEAAARADGDQDVASAAQAANDSLQVSLEGQIANEASLRAAADAGLDTRISAVEVYESRIAALETQLTAALDLIAELQSAVAALDPDGELAELANHVVVDDSTINGLIGPHIMFHDANVHVQNGSGYTGIINGLGNLIVGYNESAFADEANRDGSHNLVVGEDHEYIQRGGFVAGRMNKIIGAYSSVSGGINNTASGAHSSVSGGVENTAGFEASVSGGAQNTANARWSSISGGMQNAASSTYSSVSGGAYNTASGPYSSVSGGLYNTASGDSSSVSGGDANTADGEYSSVGGGYHSTASGDYSSVSGGWYRSVNDDWDWRAGSLLEDY